MWPKRLRQSSSQRPKTTATPHAPPAKLSVNSRLNQLRYYGNQMTALDALRNELRQFAVRLKVEAVSLSDMQRAAGLDGSVGDLDDKDAATVGFSSAGSGISGEYTAGRGSAAAAAAVSAGTRASSSSCSGACWDDARSFATTAAAASIADTDDTDSNSGSVDDEEDEEADEYKNAVNYVSSLMDAEFNGSYKSDTGGDESSDSEIYSVHQL
uniref:RNA polymerase II nuclear localization protein SLC7A6OS n=1 Tax=Macrostomum lignano TaxID=282301 RepID=A0A1I8JD11_9PLAT